MSIDIRSLHPLEIKVLLHVQPDKEITSEKIISELDYNIGQCNQAFSWLSAKNLISESERTVRTLYEITDLGRTQQELGTPGERIVELVQNEGPATLPQLAQKLALENADVGSAFGMLAKAGTCALDEEKRVVVASGILPPEIVAGRALLQRALDEMLDEENLNADERAFISKNSKKRGATSSAFKIIEREELSYKLTAEGIAAAQSLREAQITGNELGVVTAEILASGTWREQEFRPYSLNAKPARLIIGRKNPYAMYLQWVKDKLVSLGFEEFDGPLVESEFWNGDALFMPQFHSARDIHDVYYVAEPDYIKEIDEPYLSQVAATHENGWTTGSRGWGYQFDHDFTRRQILRSQGTVLSAKTLPKAKVPGKYFGVVRCFRYDQVDATHGADFYQTEGIVLGEKVNLRTLLGLLKMFAEEVAGAEEVRYVPGYFPFTEPSIEVHIKHPTLGWFELGGSGIFRPEVTKPLGIDVPVLAWGLGIDRMALMHLQLNDLRDLFSANIESVRMRRGN